MRSSSAPRARRALFGLCVALCIAIGYVALTALARQPYLKDETGALLTAEGLRNIVAIEDLALAPDFFDALPGAARSDAQWWRLQQQVDRALSDKQRVIVRFAGDSEAHGRELAIVRPGLKPLANEALIFYFCGFAYVVGALFVFVRHPTTAGLLLALDFLSSAVTLFCAGATSLRHVSLPYETHRLLAGLSATGTLGFLVSAHFFLSFPTAKPLLARIPKWVVASAYGAAALQCLLIYLGELPSASTFPVAAALNIVMSAALIHSFVTERDGFIKLQLGFLLGVVISGVAVLYACYAFAPLLGRTPLEPAHIALMFLVGLFGFVAVFENVTLYEQKLRAEDYARMEKEHLRAEFHDNMLNRLANIALLSDAALHDRRGAAARDKLAAIKREASSSSRYARGLLWISDERCSWDEFFSHLRQYGNESLADHDLDFDLVVNQTAAPREAPLPIKACVYKVFFEALANTVKHASARRVRMVVDVYDSQLECRYADDGQGFDPDVVKLGHYGLQYMRRCVQGVGGTLAIGAAADGGTSIALSIPL